MVDGCNDPREIHRNEVAGCISDHRAMAFACQMAGSDLDCIRRSLLHAASPADVLTDGNCSHRCCAVCDNCSRGRNFELHWIC